MTISILGACHNDHISASERVYQPPVWLCTASWGSFSGQLSWAVYIRILTLWEQAAMATHQSTNTNTSMCSKNICIPCSWCNARTPSVERPSCKPGSSVVAGPSLGSPMHVAITHQCYPCTSWGILCCIMVWNQRQKCFCISPWNKIYHPKIRLLATHFVVKTCIDQLCL